MASGASSRARGVVDPTYYPVHGDPAGGDMGEGSLQRFIAELLRPLVERWLGSRGERAFVGADQYFYWEQHNPSKCVAPDVYVVPGFEPGLDVDCWKTWESGGVPSFALEVVSRDHDKDYLRTPPKYGDLGVRELVIFDPDARGRSGRVTWQVFRRTRGELVRVVASDADRVRSRVLGCWLRVTGEGGSTRVRLATGLRGETIFPTYAEAERERAEAERAHAEAERERADRAEAELARLRAELAARTAPRKRR